MSITDELRKWKGNIQTYLSPEVVLQLRCELAVIADRIDAEHERAVADAELAAAPTEAQLEELGYIKGPVDADGVPIRPGDELVIFETGERIRAYDIELYDDGRWIVGDEETMDSIHPDRLRHHHAPTVEDVLREFADDVYADSPNVLRDRDAIVERYAAKLRLAEDVDA